MPIDDILLEILLDVHSGLFLLLRQLLNTSKFYLHSVLNMFGLNLQIGILLHSGQFLDSDLDPCVDMHLFLGSLDAHKR